MSHVMRMMRVLRMMRMRMRMRMAVGRVSQVGMGCRVHMGQVRMALGCRGHRNLHQGLLRERLVLLVRLALIRRTNHIAVALEPHVAHVLEAYVLQQLRELGVSQGRLREFRVVAGPEEALHVGQGDGRGAAARQDLLEALLHLLPVREVGAGVPRRVGAGPLLLGTALLDHRLGALVGHHRAVEVAQQLLLADGQLHDVTHLAQGTAVQEVQAAAHQGLGAAVPAAGEDHVGVIKALEVGFRGLPQLLGIEVLRAVDVHEVQAAAAQEGRPIPTLLGLHVDPGASVANPLQPLDVHVHVRQPHLRGALCEAFPQDPAVRLQLIQVQGLHRGGHLVHIHDVVGLTGLALAPLNRLTHHRLTGLGACGRPGTEAHDVKRSSFLFAALLAKMA
mmetsp:Transcript_55008/g.131475  ORF Transcript_55008/g.131475 Transcript_55008/m.131475 type:complete len:391 (-) Transcript_55008:3-1175(-)